MSTNKRVFTLRLEDEIFEQIEDIAKTEHRSMTNLIEYALLKYLNEKKNRIYSDINIKQAPEAYLNEKSDSK
jgi:hypothetical protein